tara:strand:- start:764 stop:1399 length:636 start_codon:yes stop_codon:yes gene_type:complete
MIVNSQISKEQLSPNEFGGWVNGKWIPKINLINHGFSLKFYKLYDDVEIPKFETQDSACFDLKAYLGNFELLDSYRVKVFTDVNNKEQLQVQETVGSGRFVYIPSLSRAMIPTGLIIDIPRGFSVRIHPRSGISLKEGLTLANSEGIIDSDYVDPFYLLMFNNSSCPVRINHGQRIAQGELVERLYYNLEETKDYLGQKTDRAGGMGSTGE